MCLPDGLFAEHDVAFLIRAEGGPGVSKLSLLRIYGVVSSNVVDTRVVESDGTSLSVHPNVAGAFMLTFPAANVHGGIVPTEVDTTDATGATQSLAIPSVS